MANRSDVINMVEQMAQALGKAGTSARGDMMLIGGAAMGCHDLRDSLSDIDFWCSNKTICQRAETFSFDKDPDFHFDATNDRHVWGQVNFIGKPGDDGFRDCETRIKTGGMDIRVQIASIETMFIMKTDAAREKDIADLPLLASKTSPAKIIGRMAEIGVFNDPDVFFYTAENLLSEIQCQFGVEIDPKMIRMLNLEEGYQAQMGRSFGLDVTDMEAEEDVEFECAM